MNRREFLSMCAAARISLPQPRPIAPGVSITERPRDYSGDLRNWLRGLLADRQAQRKKIVAGLNTKEKVIERQRFVRAKLWELLGGPFEKTPLNPRITGTIERDGYRIDKLIYESRPGLLVTSNLYVPAGRGPFPAVLSSMGHSGNGKAYVSYQSLFHTLAKKGYVVLAFDPFGQGERIEYPGARPGVSSMGGGTSEHSYAGRRLLLLGANFGLYRTWDGIRGMDYLLTRDDVDPKRIGCGGQSGGATMTMFLAALDERIAAAVVSEGNTENMAQENVEPPGSVDDAEQNIVPAPVYGFDRFDLLHCVAPRPLFIAVTNKDAGTTYSPKYITDSYALLSELKSVYSLFNSERQVELGETAVRHGYVYELRRASYRWYNQWLGGQNKNDEEPPPKLEPDANLYCTSTGFVVTSLKGETAFTLTRKLSQQTRPTAAPSLETIRRVLGIEGVRAPSEIPPRLSSIEKYDHVIDEWDVASEPGIHLPAWTVGPLKPAGAAMPAVLMLSDAGKDDLVLQSETAAEFARAGVFFAAADLRGRGQCTPDFPKGAPRYFAGRGEEMFVWSSMVAGRPLLGGYVVDALAVLAALRRHPAVDPKRVSIIGSGTMGVVALLAIALDPALRGGIVQNALANYRSIVENDRYTTPFRIFLYGVLKQFDLPDVAKLIAPRPLLVLNPVDHAGRPAELAAVQAAYAPVTVRREGEVNVGTYLGFPGLR